MMNNTREAFQLLNLIKFINEYCVDLTQHEIDKCFSYIGECANNLTQWDIDLIPDREYDVLTLDFWVNGKRCRPITTEVDFDKIGENYDIDNLPYSVCNKGLN